MENNRYGGDDTSSTWASVSSILRGNTSITGIVEDARVVNDAVEPVARGVSSLIAGISGTGRRRSRGDVLSHIEKARDMQASRLCESLGNVLDNTVNPPRSLSDIAKEYCDAERSLRSAIPDQSESFWCSICFKLQNELEHFGSPSAPTEQSAD